MLKCGFSVVDECRSSNHYPFVVEGGKKKEVSCVKAKQIIREEAEHTNVPRAGTKTEEKYETIIQARNREGSEEGIYFFSFFPCLDLHIPQAPAPILIEQGTTGQPSLSQRI